MNLEIDLLSSEAPKVLYKKRSSEKFVKIYRKTLVLESLFKKPFIKNETLT